MSKELFRVVLDLVLDRELNPADPPNLWNWQNLLDMGEHESVQLVSASWMGQEKGNN